MSSGGGGANSGAEFTGAAALATLGAGAEDDDADADATTETDAVGADASATRDADERSQPAESSDAASATPTTRERGRQLMTVESYRVEVRATRSLSAFVGATFVALGCGSGPGTSLRPEASEPAPVASIAPLASASSAPAARPRFTKEVDVSRFRKGNVHTHSIVSDGDSTPATVVGWYRDHGYDFVALTEHNILVDPEKLAALETDRFEVIAGEEITMTGGGRQVHVNGLCVSKVIRGGTYATPRAALDHAITSILEQQGVALVNHPNFDWALSQDDVSRSTGAQLLEIASGHPRVHTDGDCDDTRHTKETTCHPSHESLWQGALAAGLDIAPVAVDDAHEFRSVPGPLDARAGRAWIQVFSRDDGPDAICDRLRAGDLYASTGAEITRLRVRDDRITVWPADPNATVEFIGVEGTRLEHGRGMDDGAPSYALAGNEPFVRVRVTDSNGARAWLPAFRTQSGSTHALPTGADSVHDARDEAR